MQTTLYRGYKLTIMSGRVEIRTLGGFFVDSAFNLSDAANLINSWLD